VPEDVRGEGWALPCRDGPIGIFDVGYDHVLGPDPVAPAVTGVGCGSPVAYDY
jgi:hypothetical protein